METKKEPEETEAERKFNRAMEAVGWWLTYTVLALACVPSLLVYKQGYVFLDQLGLAGGHWHLAMLFVVAPLAGVPEIVFYGGFNYYFGDFRDGKEAPFVGALLSLLWRSGFWPASWLRWGVQRRRFSRRRRFATTYFPLSPRISSHRASFCRRFSPFSPP
jgi:hypothetical protein